MAWDTAEPQTADAAFERSTLPGWIRDARGALLAVNDAFARATAYARERALGMQVDALVPTADHETPDHLRRLLRADGSVLEIELSASIPIRHAGSDALLELFRPLVDPVTGLPDREALLRSETHGRSAVLLVSVAWPAQAARHGQASRDRVARAVAAILAATVPSGAMLARYSEDTFATRLDDGRARTAATLARRLLAAFERPIVADGDEVSGTPSIGIAAGSGDVTALIRDAETALEHARASRSGLETYDDAIAKTLERRVAIERNLRHAILDGRVAVVYQPIVTVHSADVVGAEALMRWDCPGLGLVAPSEFIAIADDSRAIVRLGEWILREAAAQNRRWQLAGLPRIRISVNVSARQVAQREFVRLVHTIIESTSLDAGDFEIELTDTAAVCRDDASRRTVEAVRRLGAAVSIDDFGSGYSSVADLGTLPADRLKLDRTFIQELGKDGFKTDAAGAIIGLAHRRNLKVVAVGVETAQQVALLREMECDEMQGFLLGRPTDAAGVAARLERDRLRLAVQQGRM